MKQTSKSLNIVVVGLGTVGSSLVSLLSDAIARGQSSSKILGVSAGNMEKHLELMERHSLNWFDSIDDIINSEATVVVELVGGSDGFAYELVKRSIEAGKHVVTANKALLAKHGVELSVLSKKHNIELHYEAAIAAGIPIVSLLRQTLRFDKISEIRAILNSTSNFILSQMALESRDFESALKLAQDMGYAELEPSTDVDGWDSVHKIALLSCLAWGRLPDINSMHRIGIRNISRSDIAAAKRLGCEIKLIAKAKKLNGHIEITVSPMLVKSDSMLGMSDGVLNCTQVKSDSLDVTTMVGPGAGGTATANSVLSDLLSIESGHFEPMFGYKNSSIESLDSLHNISSPAKVLVQGDLEDLAESIFDVDDTRYSLLHAVDQETFERFSSDYKCFKMIEDLR